MHNRKILYLVIVMMLNCFIVTAQHYENEAINWYEGYFNDTFKKRPVDDAIKSRTLKLEEAREVNDLAEQAKIFKELGLIHFTRTHDYEQAMDYLIQSLAIEDSLSLKNRKLFTYVAIADIFEEVGDNFKSAEFLHHALDLNEEDKNIEVLVFILTKLGKINAAMGKIEDAFENYELILQYKEELQNQGIEAEALFNLAHLQTLQGKYAAALQQHKAALALKRLVGNKKSEALSLNDIGELYKLMKYNDKALANHTVALQIRQKLGDKKEIAESYNNIAAIYYEQKKFQPAIDNLSLGLDAALASQSQYQIRKSYEFLALTFKEVGDFKKAFEYQERYAAIDELIQNEKSEQRLLEVPNRYMLEKKEVQIGKLESARAQKEKELLAQKKISNFLFAVIILSVIIVLLIFYLYILNRRSSKALAVTHAKVNKQNIELQELNATKDKFFSIISHDLKGPLNSLTSFSGLLINHTESLSKDEIKMLALDLDKSLKNLFALLENLLEWSRSQTGNIEFKPEAFDLTLLLEENKQLLQGQAQNKRITIVNKQQKELKVMAHRHSVNTVVRNLISNAIKFTPEEGVINLSLHEGKDNITVAIADTGIGMTAEVIKKLFRIDTKYTTKGTSDEKGTGLGLILCKEFIEKNGGNIWVESEMGKGSVFYFTLPNMISQTIVSLASPAFIQS